LWYKNMSDGPKDTRMDITFAEIERKTEKEVK
jgi:hypothetical protein